MLPYYWTCFKLRVTCILILLKNFIQGQSCTSNKINFIIIWKFIRKSNVKYQSFEDTLSIPLGLLKWKHVDLSFFRVHLDINNLHSFAFAKYHLWIVGTLCIVIISWIWGTFWIVGTLSTVTNFWICGTSWIVGTHFLSPS